MASISNLTTAELVERFARPAACEPRGCTIRVWYSVIEVAWKLDHEDGSGVRGEFTLDDIAMLQSSDHNTRIRQALDAWGEWLHNPQAALPPSALGMD